MAFSFTVQRWTLNGPRTIFVAACCSLDLHPPSIPRPQFQWYATEVVGPAEVNDSDLVDRSRGRDFNDPAATTGRAGNTQSHLDLLGPTSLVAPDNYVLVTVLLDELIVSTAYTIAIRLNKTVIIDHPLVPVLWIRFVDQLQFPVDDRNPETGEILLNSVECGVAFIGIADTAEAGHRIRPAVVAGVIARGSDMDHHLGRESRAAESRTPAAQSRDRRLLKLESQVLMRFPDRLIRDLKNGECNGCSMVLALS
jgi:hypothetical protein